MTGRPLAIDILEPKKVARSVQLMKVKHAVITSVDRDDLKDGGASIWVETINEIRKENPETTMETLIPDFKGKLKDIQPIIDVAPEVVSHNMETVRRLTKKVRIQAKYDRSLNVLRFLNEGGIKTKSGIMLGLGETEAEVVETMHDLREVGVYSHQKNILLYLSLLLLINLISIKRLVFLLVFSMLRVVL
jgi:lipoic acid synthetase